MSDSSQSEKTSAFKAGDVALLDFKAPQGEKERDVTIRFLPCNPIETRNFTSRKFYKIYYQNSIFAEQSLLDNGLPDPIYEYVDALYSLRKEHLKSNNLQEAERIKRLIGTSEIYRYNGLKPICEYFSNVLVVEDKQYPENEGKTFVYKFNKWIWKMLKELKEKRYNCFNVYEAPLFRLHTHLKEDNRLDYLDTGFILDKLYSIAETREEINKILNDFTFPLTDLGIKKSYKTYDELKVLFIRFMGRSYYENLGIGIPTNSPIYKKPSNSSTVFANEVKRLRDAKISSN